jgi:cobalt-zinc-cadmium efflux system membrane fusion protein
LRKHPFVFVLTLFCLLITACNGRTSDAPSTAHAAEPNKDELVLTPAQQAAGMIQTQTVTLSDAPDILRVAGRIALADDRTWRVGVRADGLVMDVYAGLGDFVQKGQVLARYHADEVREARAQYRKSLAELNRAQAGQALAQRNFDRAQTLLSLKAGSVQQVEQARQDLLGAQTVVRSAQIEVDRGKDQLEDDLRVPADPAPGAQDETADQVPILAPASGYVIEKFISPGKTVQPSTDTYVIGDLSQVWMLASVRQEKLGQLRLGQNVVVTLPGEPSEHFAGKLTNLGQELDETTRVMQVRIVLNNPGNRLKPEMLANAEIPVGERKPALLVPSDSIQQIENQDIVFVRAAPDRFAIRPVRVGDTSDGKTPILEGLKPGEQIVVQGSFVLKSQRLKSTMESE